MTVASTSERHRPGMIHAAVAKPGLYRVHEKGENPAGVRGGVPMKRSRPFLALPSLFAAVLVLTGCGTNPVTGKREIQFISETQELQIGEKNYSPTKQSEGGDYKVLPELTTYVNEVGQKLAAVSDRPLPYEFTVLNSSVPNAWALPGGKIAVNRGLLTELDNEAELAAVLGHEIVHAAARHGAQAQERGTLLQVGLAATQIGAAIGGVDSNVAGLLVQGAGIGAQLIHTKYGRDAELESDHYGMKYMKLAGYEPWGAVTLQETFVRLSSEGGRQQNWLEGLFASHPPSQERVDKNKATVTQLGRGGDVGKERFAAKMKPLLKVKPAYDKYDESVAAARKKDYAKAKTLVAEASRMLPQEARFHQMMGELALQDDEPKEAVPHYQRAIELDPGYFGSYLGAGVAQYELGEKAKAQEWLTQSAKLLPTAPAAYYMGNIARERGDTASALKYYEAAAGSQSELGKRAASEYTKLDLPRNPGNYVATAGRLDGQSRLILLMQNRASVPLKSIQITPVLVDGSGRVVQQASTVRIGRELAPGEQLAIDAGVGQITQQQLAYVRFRVEGARIAE
jgi:predicted Zn-dependent protease